MTSILCYLHPKSHYALFNLYCITLYFYDINFSCIVSLFSFWLLNKDPTLRAYYGDQSVRLSFCPLDITCPDQILSPMAQSGSHVTNIVFLKMYNATKIKANKQLKTIKIKHFFYNFIKKNSQRVKIISFKESQSPSNWFWFSNI